MDTPHGTAPLAFHLTALQRTGRALNALTTKLNTGEGYRRLG